MLVQGAPQSPALLGDSRDPADGDPVGPEPDRHEVEAARPGAHAHHRVPDPLRLLCCEGVTRFAPHAGLHLDGDHNPIDSGEDVDLAAAAEDVPPESLGAPSFQEADGELLPEAGDRVVGSGPG